MAKAKIKGPRIRKVAPQPTEGKAAIAKRPRVALGALARPLASAGRLLRPLAPIARAILKVLNWLVPRYFVNAWRELQLVTWPTRRESWRLTGAVFIFVIIFGALLTVVDRSLDSIFKHTVLK